ncbi:hypothetical protein PoB_005493800 [Plakobranchus ocellatus]|uniref:Uncharacterized protein n=1 Tax=Plakobranchus ocellatus TaxID=259542 RepID=A0AAV4C965_9GAST|nr:hypothetical protein PoB_005493800 [Plakobranchus ocellatus]
MMDTANVPAVRFLFRLVGSLVSAAVMFEQRLFHQRGLLSGQRLKVAHTGFANVYAGRETGATPSTLLQGMTSFGGQFARSLVLLAVVS